MTDEEIIDAYFQRLADERADKAKLAKALGSIIAIEEGNCVEFRQVDERDKVRSQLIIHSGPIDL